MKAWNTECRDQKDFELTSSNSNLITDGNNKLTTCNTQYTSFKSSWSSLTSFTSSYLMTAFKLADLMGTVTAVFSYASGCQEDTTAPSCPYRHAVVSLTSQVWLVTEHAFFIEQALRLMQTDCKNTTFGWPFTQTCSTDYCDFKYALSLPRDDAEAKLDKLSSDVWKQLDINYWLDDARISCNKFQNKFKGYGFGYTGYWGYANDGDGTIDWRGGDDDCSGTSTAANHGYIIFGGIRSFCLPESLKDTCQAEIDTDLLWGFNLDTLPDDSAGNSTSTP